MASRDPVCGMMVEESRAKGTSVHAGATYYFCAPVCKQRFDAGPARFLR